MIPSSAWFQSRTTMIGGLGEPHNGLGVAIVETVIWCLILVVPGWLRFLRGDLK